MTTTEGTMMSERTWREHDHTSAYQVCRDCGLRLGEGITTAWGRAYYADDHDPAVCPDPTCGGPMGVDHPLPGEQEG